MPNIIAKLLLAMVTLVGTPFVFMVLFVMAESTILRGDRDALIFAGITSLVLFAIAWVALWWGDIRWTKRRAGWSLVVAAASLPASCALTYLIMLPFRRWEDELFIIFAAGICYLLWIVSSILCWRETRAERGARISKLSGKGAGVPCPTCGYDMTGLKEAKCPECGAAYTLDQLYLAWRPEHETLSASSPHTS